MKTARVVTCCVFLLFAIPDIARAKDWRGIVPLHSTRADVRRLLVAEKRISEEEDSVDEYEVQGDKIAFYYSRGLCERGLPGGWNVPSGTVVKIGVNLAWPPNIHVSNFLESGKEYKQKVFSVPNNPSQIFYTDNKEGVEYRSYDGKVFSIIYLPDPKDRELSCGDYLYAAQVPTGANPNDEPDLINIYQSVYWETEKEILDYLRVNLESAKDRHPASSRA